MDRGELEAYAKQLSGKLPDGMEGTVGLREWGNGLEAVCTTRVQEATPFVPLLLCRDSRFKEQIVIDATRGKFDRAFVNREFESVKVNRKFAIQVAPNQDENWLLQLFDPVFLDWLGENAPEDFHFALQKGKLEATLAHEPKDTGELDKLASLTAHVAERLRKESLEQAPVTEVKGALPPPEMSAHDRKVLGKVKFDEPPKDMSSAVSKYARVVRWEPGTWRAPVLLGGGLFLFIGLMLWGFNALFNLGSNPNDGSNFGTVIDDIVKSIFFIVAVGIGALVLFASHRSITMRRAVDYGALAFMQQYGAKRGLALEDPGAFEQNFMRVKLPGSPTRVLYGKLDGIKDEGRIVVGEDDSGVKGFMAVVVGNDVKATDSFDATTTGATAAGLDALVKKAA